MNYISPHYLSQLRRLHALLNRADATWDYIATADYDEFPDFCAESVDLEPGLHFGSALLHRYVKISDGTVSELFVDEVELVDTVDPTTVVIRLGAEWEMAILNAFENKLAPLGVGMDALAEYIFGIQSPADNAFRRLVVEFPNHGAMDADWASATSALAFCPDRTA